MKLLADENIARQKIARLREVGFDILSIADLELANLRLPDRDVLLLATAQDRVVLTHKGKDFKRLHANNRDHAGILILPDDACHVLLAEAAAQLLTSEPEWRGRLARVHRPMPTDS